jgi:hypothetical protein
MLWESHTIGKEIASPFFVLLVYFSKQTEIASPIPPVSK